MGRSFDRLFDTGLVACTEPGCVWRQFVDTAEQGRATWQAHRLTVHHGPSPYPSYPRGDW